MKYIFSQVVTYTCTEIMNISTCPLSNKSNEYWLHGPNLDPSSHQISSYGTLLLGTTASDEIRMRLVANNQCYTLTSRALLNGFWDVGLSEVSELSGKCVLKRQRTNVMLRKKIKWGAVYGRIIFHISKNVRKCSFNIPTSQVFLKNPSQGLTTRLQTWKIESLHYMTDA